MAKVLITLFWNFIATRHIKLGPVIAVIIYTAFCMTRYWFSIGYLHSHCDTG